VVGILILRLDMYTGTLIEDLLRTVERAEYQIQLKRAAEEKDWKNLFELRGAERGLGQHGFEQREQIFAGAA
jgi:hypothetical protein